MIFVDEIAYDPYELTIDYSILYSTFPKITNLPVGPNPQGLAYSRKYNRIYVANNNNYGIQIGNQNADSITVIDSTNYSILTTIYNNTFNQPYTITLNEDESLFYVTNTNSNNITIIDTISNQVIGNITGVDGPAGMIIIDNLGFVNNYGGPQGLQSGNGNTVSVIDLQTQKVINNINISLAPAAMAKTPNNQYIYVACYVDGNYQTGVVNVIDVSSQTVIATINGFFGPFDITIDQKGQFAYVTNFGSNNFSPVGNTISVVDLIQNSITTTITVGIQPSALKISNDGRYLYVANYNTLYQNLSNFTGLTAGQGTINIIDLETQKVLSNVISTGQSPVDILVLENNDIVVSTYTSNVVNIITL